MRFNKQLALRIMSTAAFLSIVSSCAAPAFADAYGIAVQTTYYLENGSITVEHRDGNNYVSQKDADGNFVRREDGTLIDGSKSEKELAARKGDTDTRTDEQIKEDEKLVIRNNDQNNFDTSTSNTITINNDYEGAKAKADAPTRADDDTSAEIIIKDVNIDTSGTDKAGITVSGKGDTTIEIDNTYLADDSKNHNKVTGDGSHAGIEKTGEGTLVIRDDNDQGNGYLDVKGGKDGGAGIGSAAGKDVDNIFINNARIDADGGDAGGAGIGSGKGGNAKDITFGNGKLTGSGGKGGAALGSGADGDAENIRVGNGTFDISGGDGAAAIGSGVNGSAKDITVDNGTFDVKGGSSIDGGGAAIGSGANGNAENVSFNNGTLTAVGGNGTGSGSGANGGAGIGSGANGKADNVTVGNGTVTSTGGSGLGSSTGGAGIGSGAGADAGNININNGKVTANGSNGGAGIGGGANGSGDVTINNGSSIVGIGNAGGAGIGGGVNGSGTVTIGNGETITGNGSEGAAGIGGGKNGNGNVTINNGQTIIGNGSKGAAGIGGGKKGDGNVTINGGGVDGDGILGNGGEGGAGIGSGKGGSADISFGGGDKKVFGTGGAGAAGIGSGEKGNGSTVKVGGWRGIINAIGGLGGAGIGSGKDSTQNTTIDVKDDNGDVGVVGVTVNAEGGAGAAGIGGGQNSAGGTITINGGTVNAAAGSGAYAVGSGAGASGSDITITTDGFREGLYSSLDVTLIGEGAEADQLIEGGFVSKALGSAHWAAVKLFNGSGLFRLFHNQKYTEDYAGRNSLEDYDGSDHLWNEVERVEPSYTADGYIRCTCDVPDCKDEHIEVLPKLAQPEPEPTPRDDDTQDSVSRPWLYVTDTEHVEVTHFETCEGSTLCFRKDMDEAILTGGFDALQEVENSGVDIVTFTTNQCTSSFRVADLLNRCGKGGSFELLHTGVEARLTINSQPVDGVLF